MNLRTVTRGASTMTIALVAVGLLGSTALAYWTTTGLGSGQASAGTLGAPGSVAANPISGSSTSLRVSWSHPSGLQPTSYGVTAGSQSCTATYPATTCDVTGLTASTSYSVVVTSRYKNAWTAAATSNGTTNPAAPSLTVTTPANGATNVATNTAISGGTNASGNVAVQIYLGTNTSGTAVGSLTGTVTGSTWATPQATLQNNTQYTAVATQSTAGGSTIVSTTFTTAPAVAAPVLTISSPAAGATGVPRVTTFSGTTTGTAAGTVTIRVYTGTNLTVTPFRTLTDSSVSDGTWSASLGANNGFSGRLAATTQYTMVVSQTGATDVSRTFTTGSTD